MKTQNIFKSTLTHLHISISRAILCLISCFRTTPPLMFLIDAQYSDYENDKEIRDEGCGIMAIEIRKASKKLNEWLPNSSINAPQFDAEMDHSPTSLLQHTPISCKSKTHKSILNGEDDTQNDAAVIEVHADNTDDITTPFTPWPSASNILSKNKSVRFECDLVTSAVKGSSPENFRCEISKKLESPWQPSVSKRTPKPTHLKLTDEMHTPGTVFPKNAESYANGKARIRSQYVYSVSNAADLCLSVAETN